MAFSPAGSKAVQALIDAGVIPKECCRFELVLTPLSAVAKLEAHLSEEQMQQIADALIAHPEEAAAIVRDVVFHAPGTQAKDLRVVFCEPEVEDVFYLSYVPMPGCSLGGPRSPAPATPGYTLGKTDSDGNPIPDGARPGR